MRTKPFLTIMLALAFAATACSDSAGTVAIVASHEVDGTPLIVDALRYANEAGNPYLVNEVQWFISNLELEDCGGNRVTLAETWYIDSNLPETQVLRVSEIPAACYRIMRFTFGLNDADNQSGRFSNPPESNMFWPDELGGGYHYMKLNGKYLTSDSLLAPMAIHLGRGQNEGHTEFYDNSFTVELPIDLAVYDGRDYQLGLVMNINKWFRNPYIYKFQHFGSAIMQNQEAQQMLKENGHDVFEITTNNQPMNIVSTLQEFFGKAAPKPNFYTKENMEHLLSDLITPKNRKS